MNEYRANQIAFDELVKFIQKNQSTVFLIGVTAEITAKDVPSNTLTFRRTTASAEIPNAKIPEYMDINNINIGDRMLFLNMNNSSQGESYFAFFNYG